VLERIIFMRGERPSWLGLPAAALRERRLETLATERRGVRDLITLCV
jgi:hypothetical protein